MAPVIHIPFEQDDDESTASFIGITVAIAGNVLISLALNCQKLAHKRQELEFQAHKRVSVLDEAESGPLLDDHAGQDTRSEDWEERTRVEQERDSDGRIWERSDASMNNEQQALLAPRGTLLRSYTSNSDPTPQRNSKSAIRWAEESRTTADEGYGQDVEAGDHIEGDEEFQETNYLKSKLWWFGFVLMNIGELGNFISYAFAPASVVAPLGTFALIANCLFAPIMLGERFRKRDLLGVLIAVIGAVTVVAASRPSDVRLSPPALIHAISQTPFIVYSAVYILGALVLLYLSNTKHEDEWVFIDVGLCALFGGFTVLSTKGLSSILTLQWFIIFTSWITYPLILVLIGTGIGQIKYLNRALMKFDSKLVIPSQFVLFNLSAIVGSAILYGDFRNTTFHQMVTFLYGCAATFCGVFLIAWSSPQPVDEDDDGHSRHGQNRSAERRDVRPPAALDRFTNAVLVVPSNAKATPVLRHRPSGVSLGLSPAHRLLLMHTPPREGLARRHSIVFSGPESPPVVNTTRPRPLSWMDPEQQAWAETDTGSRSPN